ncbi:MAG: hypothetical protein JST35_10120 [Armatimonadetes bacterium]|nr:hypothetical protein [Armatimonadota bacterium]
MSFRVNTNVTAMNALRNLGGTNTEFGKSITRLSTGMRINSAADDPAGLIISENFRAQISGLEQATKNNQDAINYAKTAEGALDEVGRLLRDARSLAVAAGNTGAASSSQIQANQSQLTSISDSISRISTQTQFGTKRLLDGSSGVNASITDATKISAISFNGLIGNNSQSITQNGAVTITVTQAATQAVVGSRDFGLDDNVAVGANAGTFYLNGVTFNATSTDTVATLRDKINAASAQTGVVAITNNTGVLTLQSIAYGSQARVDLTDSTGVLLAAPGYQGAVGQESRAQVGLPGITGTTLFTGSINGSDGLTLQDAQGNRIVLTQAGNSTSVTNASIGQLVVGAAQFQIGANAGQTTSLTLGNFASSTLGTGVVVGKNMSNLDITTSQGAQDALRVIDAAIEEVSKTRGRIGSFQRNVLESNIRSLGIAKETLSATESTIRDTDVADEMTNYTKLQILQQAGLSVLQQANSAPQNVLSLLRG